MSPFLVTKYIKHQSYQNILQIKVGLLFLYFFEIKNGKKKMRRIPPIFDVEKITLKVRIVLFRPSILKQRKGQKHFMAIYIVLCTVNIHMYKTIEARVNTIAIPTTGIYPTLYRELLKPPWVIYQ